MSARSASNPDGSNVIAYSRNTAPMTSSTAVACDASNGTIADALSIERTAHSFASVDGAIRWTGYSIAGRARGRDLQAFCLSNTSHSQPSRNTSTRLGLLPAKVLNEPVTRLRARRVEIPDIGIEVAAG